MLRRSTFDQVYDYCYSCIESGQYALDAEAVEQDLAHLIRSPERAREREGEREGEGEGEGERGHDRTVTPGPAGAADQGGSRPATPGRFDFGHGEGGNCTTVLGCYDEGEMSLDLDVVTSIFRSCYKAFMKANARLFRVDAARARELLDLWRCQGAGGGGPSPPSLLVIAQQHRLPPMKVAKAVLNALNVAKPPSAAAASPSTAVFNALASRSSSPPNYSKPLVKVEDNTSLLAFDARLRRDIEECVAVDRFEGPDSEIERQSIGQEYEYILQETLRNIGVPFQLEGHLREQGLVATPDTLLVVPAVVHNPVTNQSHVVNWIESKAMFGDPAQHKDNFYQLEKYVERYGPGMVVYWFGYVEGLNNPNDEGWPWDDLILVVSRIPPEMRAR